MNDPTHVASVCITVADENQMSAYVSGDKAEGSVFVGERVQLHGTPAQLRSLAKAIEDGAMELERQIAEGERARQVEHYAAMLAEAEAS